MLRRKDEGGTIIEDSKCIRPEGVDAVVALKESLILLATIDTFLGKLHENLGTAIEDEDFDMLLGCNQSVLEMRQRVDQAVQPPQE